MMPAADTTLPSDAALLAAVAWTVGRADALGHEPACWRRVSPRMFATTCTTCGLSVWVAGPRGGWRPGGAALRERCPA